MEGIFADIEAYALPAIGSNHSPILLSLHSNHGKRKKKFRFEAYWPDDLECSNIVKEAWNDFGNTQVDVVGKLRKVPNALLKWSRRKFSNACHQFEFMKKELTKLTNKPSINESKEMIQGIKENIGKLWRQKEMY